MKKLLAFALLVFVSNSTFAQYTYNDTDPGSKIDIRKTRFGLVVAPNISWMKPTSTKSNDRLYNIESGGSNIGFSWGLMADYFFTSNYGIATGFQLNTTGGIIEATYDINNNNIPSTQNIVKNARFDYKLQYLEIPFGLKLLSDELSGGVKVFGNIGVTLGINLSKKATYEVVYTDTANGVSIDRTVSGDNEKLRGGLAITPVLFQLNLGGGLEYPLTDKLSFYAGIFFNNGFTPDVTTPKEIDLDYKGSFSDGNTRLNNVSLRLGIFF